MIALVFGLTFALCGVAALGVAWRLRSKQWQMAKWPRTRGRIASIEIETRNVTFRDYRGYSHIAKVPFRAVKYTYVVNGFHHSGMIYEKTMTGTKNTPVESTYHLGQEVEVTYDPSEPKTGYLELPRTTGAIVIGVIGAAFMVIGFAAAALAKFAF